MTNNQKDQKSHETSGDETLDQQVAELCQKIIKDFYVTKANELEETQLVECYTKSTSEM